MSTPGTPRFRFAPSPTGSLHVGSLHTAVFNWALARSMGGDLILRIDDTDPARNQPGTIDQILDDLRWLGLDWDEGPDQEGPHGPYLQSQRRQRHEEVAAQLVQQGDAYYGDDPHDEADPERDAPLRLRLPREGETVVKDSLRGAITFDNGNLADPIIMRTDGSPLYHLASVVDDHDMKISHVARGEEWISSAPFHVHLYRKMGWTAPTWIHLPLIRDEQGRKLSKRAPQGGTLVHDFREAGYLPEALFNYLLLLGWSPEATDEIVNKWHVRRHFDIKRLSASPATFDWAKLNWFNRHYLKQMSDARLARLIRPYLEDAYGLSDVNEGWLERLTALIRDDLSRLDDAVSEAEWALSETYGFTIEAEEALESEGAHVVLVRTVAELAHVVLLDEETARRILEGVRTQFAESHGWEARDIYWPLRAALTGRVRGPALHEVMGLLGKARCMERLAAVLRTS